MENTNTAVTAEQNKTQTNTEVIEPNKPNTTSSQDLVSRVSSVQPKKEEQPVYDRNKDEAILATLTPEQKAQVEAYKKSLYNDSQKKWQEAADMKRQAEALANQPWTPQRIQQLTNDPNFVQAANSVLGQAAPQNWNGSQEEWSSLTDTEKVQFREMRNQIAMQSNQLSNIIIQKEDESLSTRYKNYDPMIVNKAQEDILSGKVNNMREYVFKAVDYENAIERAYRLGLEDRQEKLGEKLSASTNGGNLNVHTQTQVPVQQPKQSFSNYFRELAQNRLKALNSQKQQR